MSKVIIQVENLTKEYRLGVINHGTLQQDLQSYWARMRGREDPNSLISFKRNARSLSKNPHLLALNDISFDVVQGEILGIIGRNGAGKSTLLKILSRVTAPTKGTVKIRGRVASLLEVGTGFHPELTGRENIFLNGAILGMNRKEIHSKFDEIVDFSGVEDFIDTPVKRYSSGMYVRLAFAVAAHLEPEILVVDEVLAVGDAQFQKKCLGKMGAVAKEGRTILFVSHNMGTLKQLCSRAILLEKGIVQSEGATDDIISMYLGGESDIGNFEYQWKTDSLIAPGDKTAQMYSIRLCSDSGQPKSVFGSDEPIYVEIEYEIFEKLSSFRIGFSLHSSDDTYIFYSSDDDNSEFKGEIRTQGKYRGRCCIPANLLNMGKYYVCISGGIFGERIIFEGLPLLTFSIESTGGAASRTADKRRGVLCPHLNWEVTRN